MPGIYSSAFALNSIRNADNFVSYVFTAFYVYLLVYFPRLCILLFNICLLFVYVSFPSDPPTIAPLESDPHKPHTKTSSTRSGQVPR